MRWSMYTCGYEVVLRNRKLVDWYPEPTVLSAGNTRFKILLSLARANLGFIFPAYRPPSTVVVSQNH